MKAVEDSVQDTMNEVLRNSLRFTKSVESQEELINKTLDIILEFTEVLKSQMDQLESINSLLNRLTWITDTSNQQNIEDIEIILRNLTFLRDHVVKNVKEHLAADSLIARDCPLIVKAYMETIEDFEESLEEVYNIFFVLPYDEEYQELQRQIADC
jgi:hypothetical protein